MRADLDMLSVPQVATRVTSGDCTANASPSDDAYFHAFWSQLTGVNLLRWSEITISSALAPRQAAAAALGMPAKDHVVDLGYPVLIIIGPDVTNGLLIYRTPTMNWVNAQLQANQGRVCMIAAHAPLKNTVLQYNAYGSEMYQWCAMGEGGYNGIYDDTDIRAVLADNPNCKAWLSGHTHSLIEAPDIVKAEPIGGHTVAAINCSAILPPGYAMSPNTGIASPFVTVYDDRIEVRWRDHSAHQWVGSGPDYRRCWTIPLGPQHHHGPSP